MGKKTPLQAWGLVEISMGNNQIRFTQTFNVLDFQNVSY